MTEQQLELIIENAKMVISHSNKILEHMASKELAQNPESPFYRIFSTEEERQHDIEIIDKKINREITILQGLLK